MLRKILYSLLSIIFLMSSGCQKNDHVPDVPMETATQIPSLTLLLELDKSVYSKNEPIFISVKLQNISASALVIKKRMLSGYTLDQNRKNDQYRDIRYYITSPTGTDIRSALRYEAGKLDAQDFVSLEPGESIDLRFDLREFTPFPEEYGKFTVFAIYYNYFDPSPFSTAWKGELQSNLVEFEIRP